MAQATGQLINGKVQWSPGKPIQAHQGETVTFKSSEGTFTIIFDNEIPFVEKERFHTSTGPLQLTVRADAPLGFYPFVCAIEKDGKLQGIRVDGDQVEVIP